VTALATGRANPFAGLTDADFGFGQAPPKVYAWQQTEKTKAQVTELCAGIEIASKNLITRAFRSDLQRYASELRQKPTRTRQRRRFLDSPAELREKIADETEVQVDVIAETWERPELMALYRRIGIEHGGSVGLDDLEAEEIGAIAWYMTVELADYDQETGRVRLLSDCEDGGRRYPGAPLPDKRCMGKQLRGLAVEDVRDAWELITFGMPAAEIEPEQRKAMRSPHGIRISARAMAYQANALERIARNDECKCPGRADVAFAWELKGHDEGCRCLRAWVSVDTARRAIKTLTAEGVFVRTAAPYLRREGHTAVGIPAAYNVAPDAGWHAYADRGAPRRRRRPKAPRKLLEAA
jgi:hypothetical protein